MFNVACWGFCIFVSSTVINGPVGCDGCWTLLFALLRRPLLPSSRKKSIFPPIFFWALSFDRAEYHPEYHLPIATVHQLVDGDNGKMVFDFHSVNCLVRWIVGKIGKVGRDVVKPLIISDNQAFSCLMIKSFDNQTCDLTFEYLDYHDQWYFLKPD